MKPINTIAVAAATVAALTLTTTQAQAVPTTSSFTARISDAAGPITGVVAVNFKIFDAASAGSMLWEENHSAISASNGLLYVDMGSVDPVNNGLDSSVFSGSDAWLEISINGTAQSPRLKIGVAPYAVVAGTAETAQTLGSLGPADVAPVNHSHSATAITSGTLSTARYSCYSDLGAENRLDNNHADDLLTRSQADGRYVNVNEAINASTLTGTVDPARYDAFNDLQVSGRLDGSHTSDLLNYSQADSRYLRHSNFTTYVTSATGAGSGSNTVSSSSGYEFCALHYFRTDWAGRCNISHSGGIWTLRADNYGSSIAGSRAYCGMICINLR